MKAFKTIEDIKAALVDFLGSERYSKLTLELEHMTDGIGNKLKPLDEALADYVEGGEHYDKMDRLLWRVFNLYNTEWGYSYWVHYALDWPLFLTRPMCPSKIADFIAIHAKEPKIALKQTDDEWVVIDQAFYKIIIHNRYVDAAIPDLWVDGYKVTDRDGQVITIKKKP